MLGYMAKREYCNALTIAQQRFANAELAQLLDGTPGMARRFRNNGSGQKWRAHSIIAELQP
jgi:hypothetical protein